MPSDTEPRYRLVDSNGNVVGSLYAQADGTLAIQEGTSGSDNEVTLGTDGTLTTPALDTEELTNNPPSTPFSWESVNSLLGKGYCVNSLGNVFSGVSAPQDAIDDLLTNTVDNGGKVWLGKSENNVTGGTYNGVIIDDTDATPITIVGMGGSTVLDGGTTSHGFQFTDANSPPTQTGAIRLRAMDFQVSTDAGAGNKLDGIHVAGSGESWFNRIEVQGSDRYGIFSAPINSCTFSDCFTEGTDEASICASDFNGGNGLGTQIYGGEFSAPGTDVVIRLQNPNGNNVSRFVADGFQQTSGSGSPWLDDQTGGNVFSSLVADTVKAVGGTNIASGSSITVGETN